MNILSAINRVNRATAFRADVAIKHTVHHHSLEVAARGSKVIVAHDAGTMGAAIDVGIAEAVDHAG